MSATRREDARIDWNEERKDEQHARPDVDALISFPLLLLLLNNALYNEYSSTTLSGVSSIRVSVARLSHTVSHHPCWRKSNTPLATNPLQPPSNLYIQLQPQRRRRPRVRLLAPRHRFPKQPRPPPELLRLQTGRVERGTQREADGARAEVGGRVLGLDAACFCDDDGVCVCYCALVAMVNMPKFNAPDTSSCTCEGSTARRDLTMLGGTAGEGKSLRMHAPCFTARKASVGVSTPGRTRSPRDVALLCVFVVVSVEDGVVGPLIWKGRSGTWGGVPVYVHMHTYTLTHFHAQ